MVREKSGGFIPMLQPKRCSGKRRGVPCCCNRRELTLTLSPTVVSNGSFGFPPSPSPSPLTLTFTRFLSNSCFYAWQRGSDRRLLEAPGGSWRHLEAPGYGHGHLGSSCWGADFDGSLKTCGADSTRLLTSDDVFSLVL